MSGNRKIKMLATANLIRRFHERCPCAELYDKAIRCYETLLDVIRNPSVAEEISELLDIPALKIKGCAEDIITILLFNQENNPYLSFGLTESAPLKEVHRRGKSLIALYHPDKHLHKETFEEKAKKINEIRNKIQTLQEQMIHLSSSNNISARLQPQGIKISSSKYLRYLPFLILAAAIIIAILSILLLIFNQTDRPSLSLDRGRQTGFNIVQLDRTVEIPNLKAFHANFRLYRYT